MHPAVNTDTHSRPRAGTTPQALIHACLLIPLPARVTRRGARSPWVPGVGLEALPLCECPWWWCTGLCLLSTSRQITSSYLHWPYVTGKHSLLVSGLNKEGEGWRKKPKRNKIQTQREGLNFLVLKINFWWKQNLPWKAQLQFVFSLAVPFGLREGTNTTRTATFLTLSSASWSLGWGWMHVFWCPAEPEGRVLEPLLTAAPSLHWGFEFALSIPPSFPESFSDVRMLP